jgi:hypothetical protein
MSQAGYTPIQLYYSTTAAAVPVNTNLANGELAINITDGKLYYKNNGGTVTLLASTAGAAGDVVGPASSTDNALARFDLATGKLIQNSVGILSDAGILTGLTGLTSSGSITLSSLTSGRVPYASTGGLLTDSANLTFDGTTLTANALTTTSTVTINGGTANGVTYLNGSKVLTSGSALTFDGTNLFTAGKIGLGSATSPAQSIHSKVAGNTFAEFENTSASKIAYFGVDGTGPSIQSGASEPITFVTGGAEAMRLTSTGLGIGTSSPAVKLDILSSTTSTSNTTLQAGISGDLPASGAATYTIADLYTNDNAGGTFDAKGVELRFSNRHHISGTFYNASIVGYGSSSANSTLIFNTNSGSGLAERARISSAGYLFVAATASAISNSNQITSITDATVNSSVVTDQTAALSLSANIGAQSNTASASNVLVLRGNSGASITPGDLIKGYGSNGSSTLAFKVSFEGAIYAAGNVGINNTSPAVLSSTTQVAIKANTSADAMFVAQNSNGLTTAKFGFQFTGGVDNPVIGSYTNHPFLFLTNNTERARIDTSGNVTINGTSSIAKFNVGSTSGSSYPTYSNPNSGGYSGGFFSATLNSSDNYLVLFDIGSVCAGTDGTNGGSAIRFLTQSRTPSYPVAERARIDKTGTLLINSTATTPAGNTSIKLNTVGQIVFASGTATTGDVAKGYINFLPYNSAVNGSNSEAWANLATGVFIDSQIESGNDALCNSALLIRGQTGGSTNPGALIRAGIGNNGSSTFNQQFRVLYNGNVANSNGTYGTLSDARAKQDIIDASSQWDDIKAVRVRKYRLISDVERSVETGIEAPYQIGVVAQELQQTSPGLVEVNGDESNMMTVKSSIMYMKAIKALQEAMQRIETLETQVAALRAQ